MHTSKTRTRSFSNVLRWCCGAATKASKLAGQDHADDRHVIATFGAVSGLMENKITILSGGFRFFSGLRSPETFWQLITHALSLEGQSQTLSTHAPRLLRIATRIAPAI
jgi:hypothetical protein